MLGEMWGLGSIIKDYWLSILWSILSTSALLIDIFHKKFAWADWFLLAVCLAQWHSLFKIFQQNKLINKILVDVSNTDRQIQYLYINGHLVELPDELANPENKMDCKYFSNNQHLKCAVNPNQSCKDCPDYCSRFSKNSEQN